MDAGAAWDLYCGDITRTFPVDGRFSPEQLAVYEVVEAARAAAVDQVAPGRGDCRGARSCRIGFWPTGCGSWAS